MVKISKNSIGNVTGNDNVVIQIIDSNGKEITDNLESILERISNNSINKINTLERKIDKLKKQNGKTQKKFKSQVNEISALKAELKEKREILKAKQEREAEILQNINGIDLREIDPSYAKAYEFFIQGNPVEALSLLDRAKLIQKRKKIERAQKEEIQAWQLRLTLLESSADSKQDELDECYIILSKLEPSYSNLISAAKHFLKTNSHKKAQFYCDKALKNIKYAHELAFTLDQLGILQAERKRHRVAHSNFIEAIKIYEFLVHKSPNSYESHLAVAYSHLGHFYSIRARSKKAKKALDKAIEIQENLLQQDNDDSKYSLAMTLISAGDVQTDLNNMDEAQFAYNRALELMRDLNKKANGRYRPEIALINHNYAHALVQRTNDFDKALLLVNESITIRNSLKKLMPRLYSELLYTSQQLKKKILELKELPESKVKQFQMLVNFGHKFRSWFSF